MKRYTLMEQGDTALTECPDGDYYLVSEVEEVLKHQASAAISGMNAATAISSGQLRQAHRLRAESSPEALESERQANAILTDQVADLERRLIACEGAMLLGCDTSHKSIQSYMARYPDPYLPTSHP